MTTASETAGTSAVAHRGGAAPPLLSGRLPFLGHLLQLRRAPIELFWRARRECGEIAELDFAGNRVVLFSGEEAQEAFFRGSDEQLDQAAAYPFMTPIFGKGVVFDATPEQRRQAMRNQSLRDQFMRGHAETIVAETERMLQTLGPEGELDLLDFLAELTIYTSSACLIGKGFREELTSEYYRVFYELEKGTDALAYVNPYLPIPAFRRRDRARRRMVELLNGVFERRQGVEGEDRELFDVLLALRNEQGRPRYGINEITGMFISMMFAGHHTTSGTAAWTLIELLRHPQCLARVVDELDALFADGRDVSYQALREIPQLEASIKEALRLHPPLILLMRKVMFDFHYKGWTVPAGKLVAASPAVSNRMPECFLDPDRYDPDRYAEGRGDDRQVFAWIPFGAGRHRCVGAPFAMIQLKSIFSHLLRHYSFELAQPPESYRNDHSRMVVQLRQPCRVRYRRRAATASPAAARRDVAVAGDSVRPRCVRVDLDLCQGHGVCANEAPDVFELDRETLKVRVLDERPSPDRRAAVQAAVDHCPTRAIQLSET
jgi:sterol 14-demethylase